MDIVETLTNRNVGFAASRHNKDLKIMPTMKTIVVGCVDSRVDPVDVFGLQPGEALVIRNVGGRISHDTLRTIELLGAVAKASGKQIGPGWNIILLHHTDCGIVGCFHYAPMLLAKHLDTTESKLADFEITDPYKSVVFDVAALKASSVLSGGFTVSGLVYDVADGGVKTVVPPSPLRPEEAA